MNTAENVVSGINEEGLNTLCGEIEAFAERISDVLERINRSVDHLPDSYEGESCSKLMQRYGEINASYPLLSDNIRGYAEDFRSLIAKMHEGDQALSTIFQGATSDAQARLRVVKDEYNLE